MGNDRFVNIALKVLGIAGLLGILVASLLGNRHPIDDGVPAPPIDEVRTLDGTVMALDLKQGRPLVLNFWGAWCGPCVAELPELSAASKAYGDKVGFYGLSNNTTVEQTRELMTRIGIAYEMGEPSPAIERAYNIAAWPTTFVVDGNGVVRWSRRGQVHRHELEEALAPLLAP